ncbi:MAG: efflux RND transporter periplasmic adaptor subunit, partial [bacterium]|nr:efflux RND transporter periplasmic adaptor subunit [bacterium]
SQLAAARASAAAAAATRDASAGTVEANAASVQQAQITLDRATIASPVDGTVIARNVSVGQTVAAALQAPTLFTIARDLHKMQVDIAVGEPDIGTVRPGEAVRFTVLAYPGVVYGGRIVQVRQNPTVVSNVTTYDTIAYVENSDGRLRPGMTANASIVAAHYERALLVPLDALQWHPSATVARRYGIASPTPAGTRGARRGSQWGQTGTAATAAIVPNAQATLWLLRDRRLVPVHVRVLAVNGSTIGVAAAADAVHDGDEAVTGAS